MAFWGVEVKPGKPFTHKADDTRGRLHISQATLGIGTATKKSLVQCNVGNKTPVLLCSLFPDKVESCQMNLEFEEADEVTFSVIGPRSVHLTGYFLGRGRLCNLNDESESYGEDIADTETERSHHSDEDKYEDSFINDSDPEVYPDSAVSIDELMEERVDKKKTENRGSRRRLRKKYLLSESDDDNKCNQQSFAKTDAAVLVSDNESEDKLPISSLCKNRPLSKSAILEAEERTDVEADEVGNNDILERKGDAAVEAEPVRQTDLSNSKLPHVVVDTENSAKPKKKRTDKSKEAKPLKDDGSHCLYALKEVRLPHNEQESNDANLQHTSLPSEEVSNENVGMPKKKMKEQVKEIKSVDPVNEYHDNVDEDKAWQDEANAGSIRQDMQLRCEGHKNGTLVKKKKKKERMKEGKVLKSDLVNDNNTMQSGAKDNVQFEDLPERNELNEKQANKEEIILPRDSWGASTQMGHENGAKTKRKRKEQLEERTHKVGVGFQEDKTEQYGLESDGVMEDLVLTNEQNQKLADKVADETQPEERKKKKKKRGKTQEDGDAMSVEKPLLSTEEKSRNVMDVDENNTDYKLSQQNTLLNGLIIQEIGAGQPDSKAAGHGKKVSIHYTGKLKENGQIFDSNVGKAPLKFRLGGRDVMEFWNVGLNGMRVGDRRRITVPPEIGIEAADKNIPPTSWLVYDVELVRVR